MKSVNLHFAHLTKSSQQKSGENLEPVATPCPPPL